MAAGGRENNFRNSHQEIHRNRGETGELIRPLDDNEKNTPWFVMERDFEREK